MVNEAMCAMQEIQELRQCVQNGEVVLGTFLVELTAPGVVEILAAAGLRFVLIDAEHGTYNLDQIRRLLDMAAKTRTASLARLTIDDRGTVTKVMDAGAQGIVFPQIRTMDEVRRAVELTKYPPLGRRGFHTMRPHTDFGKRGDAAFLRQANESNITAIQIETVEAVELIEPIAATEGVDMLYVGPGDLSLNLGCVGELNDPRVQQAIERVGRQCRAHGKIAGCHIGDVSVLPGLREKGIQVFGYSAALRILKEGVEALGERVRQTLGSTGE